MKFSRYIDRDGEKQYCILIERNEIEYDTEVVARAAAKIMYHDMPPEVRKDIVDAVKQKDLLDRNLKTAISNVVNKIRFAVPQSSQMASNEISKSEAQFSIPLQFSREWKEEPQNLCDAVHDYIVKFILAKWEEMIGGKQGNYIIQAGEALDKVHDIACCYNVELYEKLR